jgi:hypothetical protein
MWVDRILITMKEKFGVKKLTGSFHDEVIICFKDSVKGREIMSNMIQDSINWVTDEFLLRRKLGADVQYGKKYSEIH